MEVLFCFSEAAGPRIRGGAASQPDIEARIGTNSLPNAALSRRRRTAQVAGMDYTTAEAVSAPADHMATATTQSRIYRALLLVLATVFSALTIFNMRTRVHAGCDASGVKQQALPEGDMLSQVLPPLAVATEAL
jgi:hypothetical protein